MIQVANLNNLWTDPVAVLGAMCTVNLGKTLSPLDSEPFGPPPGSDIRLSARTFPGVPASHPV